MLSKNIRVYVEILPSFAVEGGNDILQHPTWYADVMILFEGDHWHYFGQCIYTSGQNITSKVPIES